MSLPTLLFKKVFDNGVYVIGQVLINGVYVCDFLVPSKLQIPCSIYDYKLYQSPSKGLVLLLLNVPNRSMIEVHKGNTVMDSRGCFLVGYNLSKGSVSYSSVAMNVLLRNINTPNINAKGVLKYVSIVRP